MFTHCKSPYGFGPFRAKQATIIPCDIRKLCAKPRNDRAEHPKLQGTKTIAQEHDRCAAGFTIDDLVANASAITSNKGTRCGIHAQCINIFSRLVVYYSLFLVDGDSAAATTYELTALAPSVCYGSK